MTIHNEERSFEAFQEYLRKDGLMRKCIAVETTNKRRRGGESFFNL